MIIGLKVAGIPIQLERTHLDVISRSLGAAEGARGDAGEALGWICLYGRDQRGYWGLWLMSGEIDGPVIGSFQWQRLPSNARFDQRCRFLADPLRAVDLPIDVRLGMKTSEIDAVIGTPTSKFRNLWVYSHQQSLKLNDEPYSADNDVILRFDEGEVSAILVNYTISS